MKKLNEILSAAIKWFAEHGYTDSTWLNEWMARIRAVVDSLIRNDPKAEAQKSLSVAYRKSLRAAPKYHKGIDRFAVENVQPRLRSILQARILASADLIKLNREQAIEVTMRRFAGWASSQPPGGSPIELREIKTHIGKRLQQSTFEERRMLIDQGHKLAAAVNQTIAEGNGAIVAQWNHIHLANYDARPEHLRRDGEYFLIRNSWAHQKGLVKPGKNGYTDEFEQPSQAPYCRCTYTFYYALSKVPDDMLTEKGREMLEQTKRLK
ncbi:hypothetical protein [Petrachloros mirabilis]